MFLVRILLMLTLFSCGGFYPDAPGSLPPPPPPDLSPDTSSDLPEDSLNTPSVSQDVPADTSSVASDTSSSQKSPPTDSHNYFILVNRLSHSIEVWNDQDTVEIASSGCAYIHNSLHRKVAIGFEDGGNYLKLCRPPDSSGRVKRRSRIPERGTNYYYCREEGYGFGTGPTKDYVADNEDHLSVLSDESVSECGIGSEVIDP